MWKSTDPGFSGSDSSAASRPWARHILLPQLPKKSRYMNSSCNDAAFGTNYAYLLETKFAKLTCVQDFLKVLAFFPWYFNLWHCDEAPGPVDGMGTQNAPCSPVVRQGLSQPVVWLIKVWLFPCLLESHRQSVTKAPLTLLLNQMGEGLSRLENLQNIYRHRRQS